ncbi:hypothetical protein [Coleofasciculus sp. FACHB-1120]|nr:hypothetical protein [Coleofasciculus sp. FACHB-1120]MBD2744090.1 hypothetical protein [Coleofasciculus sp. FACHB-1120]
MYKIIGAERFFGNAIASYQSRLARTKVCVAAIAIAQPNLTTRPKQIPH